MNLIRSKSNDLQNVSYRDNDSVFYYLDFYDINYTQATDKPGLLIVELINIFDTGRLVDMLLDCEVDKILSGQYKLVLFYPREPVSYSMIENEIFQLNRLGIHNKSILIITGECGEIAHRNCPSNLTIEPFFYFDMIATHKIKGRETVSVNPAKKFLSYNGTAKVHRTMLFRKMQNRNDGYISYLKNRYCDQLVANEIDTCNTSEKVKAELHAITFSDPVMIDLTLTECLQNQYLDDVELYNNTAFSIVTESINTPGSLFVTEKTFKAILSMHPFMMVGSPGLIGFLKQQGYKSFDILFDEEYDSLIGLSDRIDSVVSQVDNFSLNDLDNKQAHVQAITQHNRQHCISKDYKKALVDLLSKFA